MLCACVKAPPPDLGPGSQPIVIGQTRVLDSKVLGEQRRVTVYLPPSYGEFGQPVVYLIVHHVTGIVQTSIDNQTMAPVIRAASLTVDSDHLGPRRHPRR